MRNITTFVLSLMLCSLALAQSGDWIEFDERGTGNSTAVLKGSLEETTTRGGERIVIVTTRQRLQGQVFLNRAYVTLKDCVQRQGFLRFVDMQGVYQFEHPFVFGDGSIGSAVAEGICTALALRIQDRNAKSI